MPSRLLCEDLLNDPVCSPRIEDFCLNITTFTNATRRPKSNPIEGPVLITCFDSVVAILCLFGNSLVILSVIRFPNLRTATNMFVVSLAVADLMTGLFIPYYVLFYFRYPYVDIPWTCLKYPCLLRYFTIYFGTVGSMVFNVGAACDRYIAIVHPYVYPRFGESILVHVAIVFGWVHVLVITTLPLFGVTTIWDDESECLCKHRQIECDLYFIVSWTYSLLVIGIHALLTLVSTTYMYARIFREAWAKMKAAASMELDPNVRKETKTSRMMVLVLGVCFLGLGPYLIAISLPYIESIDDPQGRNHESHYDPKVGLTKKVIVCLYLGKSAINPFIYGWKNKDFRMAFFKILRLNANPNPTAQVNSSKIFCTSLSSRK